jgi:hypothetical protein
MGRSVRRAVRIAVSEGRPSRRKNPPGILPAAYIRSSTSTVSGKKSMPSRGAELVVVASTCVSPRVTTTDPPACMASLPCSNVICWDPTVLLSLVVATGLSSLGNGPHARRAGTSGGSSGGGEARPVVSGEPPGTAGVSGARY